MDQNLCRRWLRCLLACDACWREQHDKVPVNHDIATCPLSIFLEETIAYVSDWAKIFHAHRQRRRREHQGQDNVPVAEAHPWDYLGNAMPPPA